MMDLASWWVVGGVGGRAAAREGRRVRALRCMVGVEMGRGGVEMVCFYSVSLRSDQ